MEKQVGIAVIGCGNFARRQHLPNLGRFGGATLEWVCDTAPEVAADGRQRFGARRWTTEVGDALDDARVDAVLVSVRDDLQAGLVAKALAAGKHVYVEKPVARSATEFGNLIAARDRAGVSVAVGFNKRFAPAYQSARKLIRAEGRVCSAAARMADDAWRWARGYPPGALLRHDACHLFDLLRWLCDDEVECVCAATSRPDEDTVLLRFRQGATAVVMNSGHATMDLPKERVELYSHRSTITVDDFVEVRTFGIGGVPAQIFLGGVSATDDPGELCAIRKLGQRGFEGMAALRKEIAEARREAEGGRPHELGSVLPNFIRDQGWRASLQEFVTAVRERRPAANASLEDAQAAAQIIDAAELSRRDMNTVRLAP